MKAKIGLIINPIAGLGGKAGYKGSDCKEHLEHALQNGYQKCSAIRARECLRHILDIKQDCILYAPAGEMGGNILFPVPFKRPTFLRSLYLHWPAQ